ncbi:hypothetical protein C8R47DRAFT_1099441 [Mycena vitilis]|nr:hypothetical protein C8R47DRAFT_1099441 [Mycena vitilis]
MTSRIPLELLEHIIDDPSMDRKTVATCGRVSSEWTPRSRHILFSTVILSGSTFPRFLDLLGSRICTFASSVHHLAIDAETHRGPFHKEFHRLVTSSTFRRLSALQSLRLSNIDWTCFSVAEQSAIELGLARLKELKKLELHSLAFHDLKGALQVANSFPLLTQLRFIDVQFSKYLQYNIASSKTQQLASTWELLEINSGDAIPSLLHCICANLALGAPLGIQRLVLLHIDDNNRRDVEEALRFVHLKLPSEYGTLTGIFY